MFGNSSSFGNSNSSSGNSFIGGNTNLGSQQGTTGNVPGRMGASTSKPGTTSFLGPNYANPLAMGLGSNTSITSAGPAFGTALYTITNTQTNTGRVTTSTTNQNNTSYGSGVGVRRLPAYATTLKIKDPPPPPSAAAVQLDLQNMIVLSPQLDSRNAIRVLIDGQAVVLQGQVVDDEERRMVENMVRLTPGVGVVRNELAARRP
jgi:BON domain